MAKSKIAIIEHTAYTEAYQRLREFHQAATDGLPFEHVKILGPSGAGKTTLLQDYANHHPRHFTEDKTVIPVLYTRVPPRPSIKKLCGRMLFDLKSPFWNKGDELDRTFQFYTLLEQCQTEIVLVDEVQHLVDRGKQKTHALVADWIKEAADETKIPWAIAGLPRAKLLDRANDQFKRRFSDEIILERFDPADEIDQTLIGGIVDDQIEQFGIRIHPSIDRVDLALRNGYAADGIMGYLLKVNAEVARIQRRESLDNCDMEVFSRAFVSKIWAEAPDDRNPFKATIGPTFTRLTGTGEPFAPDAVSTDEAA